MNVAGQKNNSDTPCVGVCSTTSVGDSICVGCGRTSLEVRDWNSFKPEHRALINERLTAIAAGSMVVPITNWLARLVKPFDVELADHSSKIKDLNGNNLIFNFTPENTKDLEAIKNLFLRLQRDRSFSKTLYYELGDRYVAPNSIDMETLTLIKVVIANKNVNVLFLQNKPSKASSGYGLNFAYL